MEPFNAKRDGSQSPYKLIFIRLIMFFVAVIVIAYFFPRETKFRYQFHEGKPWKYGLLTAPFTFPIYKLEANFNREKDSVLKSFSPYLKQDDKLGLQQIHTFDVDFHSPTATHHVGENYYKFIIAKLNEVYSRGIVSTTQIAEVNKLNHTSVKIISNNISKEQQIAELFTIRSAYEYILNSTPPSLSKSVVRDFALNNYLVENLHYDAHTTERIKSELLNSLSNTEGLVQAGERIVDRGEIVSYQTFNILRSLKIEQEQREGTVDQQKWVILGEVILISSLFAFLFLFLYLFRPRTFERVKLLFFILLMITGFAVLTALNVKYKFISIYIIPFAIVPIIIRTFFDSRTALFTHIITVLICSFMAQFPFEFILLQITVGMSAIYSLKDLTQRSQLMQSSLIIVLTYTLIFLGYALIQEGDWEKINYTMFAYFLINGLLILFSYLLIYMFEKLFGFTSHVTLVELSNINSPFLRKFSEECPGTFHHSLQVSNLAAEASMKIGANTQLIRTAALYHDIGKMENPAFFTENQSGVNPHDKLEIEQSAGIIINHIENGGRMARKLGLPQQIIDFIYTHHGVSKAKYFYNSYKNTYPEREFNEDLFQYPGPNPFTKETAILMMADSVEAASRSLNEYTEENITVLVNKIIDSQIQEGLLNNAPITLADIQKIKRIFIEKLKTYYHTRISYPELEKQPTDKKVEK